MRKICQWTILLAAICCFFACTNKAVIEHQNPLYSLIDTSKYTLDTVLEKVQVDSLNLTIVMMRAKLDEHFQPFDSSISSPVSLAIFEKESNLPLYSMTFANTPDDYPYIIPTLFKANGSSLQGQGPLFFSLDKGYGGSGSSYELFWIQPRNKAIHLVPLFKGSGELSYPYFIKQGNQLLLFEAIWNMKEGESHFSKHLIQLSLIDLYVKQPMIQPLGKTISKYQLPESDLTAKELLGEFKQKEPHLLGLSNF
ncbi:MAG: hypothetical protein B7Y76_03630 [Sphingobacteriia bacterium 35-40-5]|nr:MAG: hypothetical protein B7Y76_03630 [Sphingobacteriia bacterium 35-40-5]